jgi:hypothetical protein|tara:strand:- start:538 stop:711 length:174 start_codon:yes stop_codon:yes gene_type:complete
MSEKNKKDLGSTSSVSNAPKMKIVEVTMQEIWQHTIPKVHTSKRTYNRKKKYKTIEE